MTEKAGVKGHGYDNGVATGDYDNDGFTDLFVAGLRENVLYRNRGDGTFEDVTARPRASRTRTPTTARSGRWRPRSSTSTGTATSTCSSPTT